MICSVWTLALTIDIYTHIMRTFNCNIPANFQLKQCPPKLLENCNVPFLSHKKTKIPQKIIEKTNTLIYMCTVPLFFCLNVFWNLTDILEHCFYFFSIKLRLQYCMWHQFEQLKGVSVCNTVNMVFFGFCFDLC